MEFVYYTIFMTNITPFHRWRFHEIPDIDAGIFKFPEFRPTVAPLAAKTCAIKMAKLPFFAARGTSVVGNASKHGLTYFLTLYIFKIHIDVDCG